jgi:hypothetical protein
MKIEKNADNTPKLVIDTNSWHFKYYQRLRRFYGVNTWPSKVTSLCPYCQTMIWGSVLFVATLPLQLLGWVCLKLCRFLYKRCETMGLARLVDTVDKTFLPSAMDCDTEMEQNPWVTSVAWGIASGMGIIGIGALVVFLYILLYNGIMIVPKIPSALWSAVVGVFWGVLYFGWGVIWIGWAFTKAAIGIVSGLWWLVLQVVAGVVWLFTTAWLWLAVVHFIGWTLLVVGGSFLIALTVIQAANSVAFKKLLAFLSMKLNGYHDARKLAASRRYAEAQAARESGVKPVPRKKFAETWFGMKLGQVACAIAYPFRSAADFVWSYEIDVKGIGLKVMSPCAVAWAFFWAIKHRACPMVTFIDAGKTAQEEASRATSLEEVERELTKDGLIGEPEPPK